MKVPKKIYARFGVFGLIQATEIRATSKDVEYTRTDVFIEKAVKLFEEKLKELGFLKVERKPIVENFKKAMKL